jgi:hypothetical protein
VRPYGPPFLAGIPVSIRFLVQSHSFPKLNLQLSHNLPAFGPPLTRRSQVGNLRYGRRPRVEARPSGRLTRLRCRLPCQSRYGSALGRRSEVSTQGRTPCWHSRRRGTSLVDLLFLLALAAVSVAITGWLALRTGVSVWVLLAPVLLAVGYAIDRVLTWRDRRGDSARSHEFRGHRHYRGHQYDEAIAEYTQALAMRPSRPATSRTSIAGRSIAVGGNTRRRWRTSTV